jgi:hypothetical protein
VDVVPLGLTATAAAALRVLFGPAAAEVGDALRRYTEHALRNVGRVVEIAEERAPASMPGPPPLRVAAQLFEQAAYAEDEVVREYLGGVLASSRSPKGRDDRAVRYTAAVAGLSTYDLRAHYVFYRALHDLAVGRDVDLGDPGQVATLRVYLPSDELAIAMEFADDEATRDLEEDALGHLHVRGLLDLRCSGDAGYVTTHLSTPLEAGSVASPTVGGIDLYLWAMGYGGAVLENTYLRPEFGWPDIGVPSVPAARLV